MQCWCCGEDTEIHCEAPHAYCDTCAIDGTCPICCKLENDRDPVSFDKEELYEEKQTVELLLKSVVEREAEHELLEHRVAKISKDFKLTLGEITMQVVLNIPKRVEQLFPYAMLSTGPQPVQFRLSANFATVNDLEGTFQLTNPVRAWYNIIAIGLDNIECFFVSSKDAKRCYLTTKGDLIIVDVEARTVSTYIFGLRLKKRSYYLRVLSPFYGYVCYYEWYLLDRELTDGPKSLQDRTNILSIVNLENGVELLFYVPKQVNVMTNISFNDHGQAIINGVLTEAISLNYLVDRGTRLSVIKKQLEYRLDEIDLAITYETASQPLDLYNIVSIVGEKLNAKINKSDLEWKILHKQTDAFGVTLIVKRCTTDAAPFDFYMRLIEPNGATRERFYRCFDYEPAIDVSCRTKLEGVGYLIFAYDEITVVGDKVRVYKANKLGELRDRPVPKLV